MEQNTGKPKTCACGKPLPLPLTEPVSHAALASINEASIRAMVDAFYDRIRTDELLGPIFNAAVKDWDKHMPKMYDFWSSAVLRTGKYSGRPLEAHMELSGIRGEHFAHWIDLWERTVGEHMGDDAARVFVDLAKRMGNVMASHMRDAG